MTNEDIARLRAALGDADGAILDAALANVPGIDAEIDPYLTAAIIGSLMAESPSADPNVDRRRSLAEWGPMIRAKLDEWAAEAAGDRAGDPVAPPGLPEPVRDAWMQARTRAGEFCRGLGSVIRQWPEDLQREVWDGEAIAEEVDPYTRTAKLGILEAATSEAVAERWTPERLASELGHKTGEWSRNWTRIARTELQQVHNEGVGITALRNDGDGARVARIPEGGACDNCLRLFTEGGRPLIFLVLDLLENGTNVGKKAADWLPALGVVHPNCRCGVQTIPPGMTLDERGWLVPE